MLRMIIACSLSLVFATPSVADESAFKVGFAKRDITPQGATPMWGYGDRHAMLSQGTADPLMAKAVVIEAGNDRLAIVGMDIGRGPTAAMMEQIRKAVAEKADVGHVMIAGSHTHHGPVIELTDREGFGKGKFDDAVAYSKRLPELLIEAIVEAKNNAVPARIGVAKKNLELNRNRHTKRTPKPTDPMLAVIRFDDAAGKPIAVIANFAAHPVTMDTMMLKFSADYPGAMQNRVEESLKTNCVFMQGASGDMSPNRGELDGKQYGEALGDQVVALAQSIETKTPKNPSIQAKARSLQVSQPRRLQQSDSDCIVREGVSFPSWCETTHRSCRRHRARIDHCAAQRRPGPGRRIGRVLLQPFQPLERAVLCGRHVVLRLLQRPPHVLPHDRSGQRRRLWRRRHDGSVQIGAGEQMMNQALDQHLHDAGEVSARNGEGLG